MNKDVLIIYESFYHGNTAKIAWAVGKTLNCNTVTMKQAEKLNLQEYKFIGLGSGIYFTSHHPKLIELARQIESWQKVFLFSTHGSPFLGKYHNSLKNVLKMHTIEIIGEFSCPGYDCTGPYILCGGGNKGRPNESDQRRASIFAAKLFPQYYKDTGTVKNGKYVGVSISECIGCGKCTETCPMKVFKMKDGKSTVINAMDCIHCSLCIQNCPVKAISVQHSWREAIAIARRHFRRSSL
jgi:NAD-dependent dihydropyrimidine dehydrogenase PreA subunit